MGAQMLSDLKLDAGIDLRSSDFGRARARAGVHRFAFLLGRAAGAPPTFHHPLVSQALARYPLKQMDPLDRPYLGLAQFYAITGKPGQARRLVLEHQRTIEPWLQRQATGELELAQGQIALAEHRVADAVSMHESAVRHGLTMAFGLPELGRAYDLAGRNDSVIAVYRRYLATPEIEGAVPDALYRAAIFQRLGELYESRGDRDQAAEFYSRLVELWKDCDPELRPRVTETRRALERLTSEPGS